MADYALVLAIDLPCSPETVQGQLDEIDRIWNDEHSGSRKLIVIDVAWDRQKLKHILLIQARRL